MANFLNGGNKRFILAEGALSPAANLQFSLLEIKQRSFSSLSNLNQRSGNRR